MQTESTHRTCLAKETFGSNLVRKLMRVVNVPGDNLGRLERTR